MRFVKLFKRIYVCILTGDTDKASEFNGYFASVGVVDDGNMPKCLDIVDDNNYLTSVTVAESDVLFAINCVKNNLSCPDDLLPVLFKKLKHILVFSLHCFIISCFLPLLYPMTGEMLLLYLNLRKVLQDLTLIIDQFLSLV